MASEVDFVPFAAAAGANVLTQAEYLALAALGPGFAAGEAYSAQLNKVWRQASIMAAVLGTLIGDATGENVVDDGTTATILSNLALAIKMGAGISVDSGAANAYVLTTTPALPTLSSTVGVGTKLTFLPLNSNTGASTANTVAIVGPAGALQGGEIVALNPTTITWTGASWFLEPGSGATQTSPAAASNQAVQQGQVAGFMPVVGGASATTAGLNATSGTFTAPCDGIMILRASGALITGSPSYWGVSGVSGTLPTQLIAYGTSPAFQMAGSPGNGVVTDGVVGVYFCDLMFFAHVAAGITGTVTVTLNSNASQAMAISLSIHFIPTPLL